MNIKVVDKFKQAFSLIEAMVVVAIIAIIAVIGHKSFLGYVMRSKVSESIITLEEYQFAAMSQLQAKGEIDPYYVLFPEGDEEGWVSGVPAGGSAVKDINKKYSDTIIATSGTTGSDTYILLGVGIAHDGLIIDGADHIYMAAIITPEGVVTWKCGISASRSDTIDVKFLPNTCQESLP